MSTQLHSSSLCDLSVLCDESLDGGKRALGFASLLGASAKCISPSAIFESGKSQNSMPISTCLVVDAETLAKAVQEAGQATEITRRVLSMAPFVFIYGFRPTLQQNELLSALSQGALTSIEIAEDRNAQFRVAQNRTWCGPFSELSIDGINPEIDFCFASTMRGDVQPLIWAGTKPIFVRVDVGETCVFLCACAELADLTQKVERNEHVSTWFSRLIPLMLVMRGALGVRVWHNDNPRACFIIDDPTLRARHGFLRFDQLFEAMRQRRLSTCIAFIPWNYNRSSSAVVGKFLAQENASLCVHGCDHTGSEFATQDEPDLLHRGQLALLRMREHNRRYGIPFAPIMVFPRGLFSREAMKALKACGYLASVNTDPLPSTAHEGLMLSELLNVAVTAHGEFPLFTRRYPDDLVGFAFDLFFGKPPLAVEHHGYFRNGCGALEYFAEQLSTLDPRIEWTDLATICTTACVTRTTQSGEILVRTFTDRFRLRNFSKETQRYVLLHHDSSRSISAVTVSERTASWKIDGDEVSVRMTLEPGAAVDVVFQSHRASITVVRPPLKSFDAKVRLRRLLCEFRDNYVDVNPLLSGAVSALQQLRRNPRTLSVSYERNHVSRAS